MIPEAAVEAAARRIYLDSPTGRKTCEAWEALDEGTQSYYRLSAQRILNDAAPHMLAEAWDEGREATIEAYDGRGDGSNPYR